jgi:hypothetical protein
VIFCTNHTLCSARAHAFSFSKPCLTNLRHT